MRGLAGRRIGGVIACAVAVTVAAGASGAPVGAAPGGVEPASLPYVAMGDSFTSGPLVLPHDTTWVPQDCGQSLLNYPHLVAVELGLTQFIDVSCGGAETDDFTGSQTAELGSPVRPQFEALSDATRIVTVGIGGNDVGFAGTAVDCFRPLGPPLEQPCSPALTAGGIDQTVVAIAAAALEVGAALDGIHARAPQADVYLVGYPAAFPAEGVSCWPYVPILPEDMAYLRARYLDMNAMLAEVAAAHGATYVDIYTPSLGHDVCQPPGVAWVNGVVLVPPSFPAHPNLLGMAGAATVVAQAIRAGSLADDVVDRAADDATTTSRAAPDAARTLPATGSDDDRALALGAALGLAAAALVRSGRRADRSS